MHALRQSLAVQLNQNLTIFTIQKGNHSHCCVPSKQKDLLIYKTWYLLLDIERVSMRILHIISLHTFSVRFCLIRMELLHHPLANSRLYLQIL